MIDRQAEITKNLKNGLKDSIAFFKSLKPDELSSQVYQDGACWTVKQVLAHFITIERSMHRLFKDIHSGGSGSPEDFDVERFNRTQPAKLDRLDVDELIQQFRSVRQETVSIVKKMSEHDFDREGYHPFHGHGKLARFIRWAYEHVRIHENDIRKALHIK